MSDHIIQAAERVKQQVAQRWRIRNLQDTSVLNDFRSWDLKTWGEAVQSFPQAAARNEELGAQYGGEPVRDACLACYRADPELQDPVAADIAALADLLRQGMQTPDWKKMKETTIGDALVAAVAASHFMTEFLANLPDDVQESAQEAAKAAVQAQEIQERLDGLQSLLEALLENQEQPNSSDDLPQRIQEAAEDLEQIQTLAQDAQAALAAANAAYQEAAERAAPQILAAANQAAGQARVDAQQMSTWVRGFTEAAGGNPQHVSPAAAQAAMQALQTNRNLKLLAEHLGWARRTTRAAWREAPHAHTELTGYRTQELSPENMASWEMTALLSPGTPANMDFQRRALEGEVVHREFGGKAQQGRGPLILVRDESGSMSGHRHSMAVAIEWALLEVARRDKRAFYCLPFSGSGELEVWKASASGQGQGDPEDLLRHLEHFYGGGTEPYQPLQRALEILDEEDLRADVLVLTDADFPSPSEDFLNKVTQAKERRPLHIVTVLIGAATGRRAEAFSDIVIPVKDLLEERDRLSAAFAGIL